MESENNGQVADRRAKLLAQLIDLRRDAGMTRIYTAFSIPGRNKTGDDKRSADDEYFFTVHS